MNRITILRNPAQSYWNTAVKQAFTQEEWSNSIHDYKAFRGGFDKFAFLAAVDSESHEFVGSVCVGTYTKPEPLSSIGMFIVKNEFQGRGIGRRLFDEAVSLCAPRKFLYGVEKLMPLYRDKYELNQFPDWLLLGACADICNVKPSQLHYDPALNIKSPEECGWEEIVKYYRKFLPQLDGSQLIKALLCESQAYCGVAVTKENKIAAIVRIRETFNKELYIGPLLGDSSVAASTVLRHVLSRIDNLQEFTKLKFEFPDSNKHGPEFMRQMTSGRYTITKSICYPQFTHEAFELPVHQIYTVSTGYISIV